MGVAAGVTAGAGEATGVGVGGAIVAGGVAAGAGVSSLTESGRCEIEGANNRQPM